MKKDSMSLFSKESTDIEDLVKIGRDSKVCPFYITRSLQGLKFLNLNITSCC
jgi:hypothetical protein